MKHLNLPLLCTLVCTIIISSCSKDELSTPILDKTNSITGISTPQDASSFLSIETVTDWYLNNTSKIDYVKSSKPTYEQIKDDSITVTFNDPLYLAKQSNRAWGDKPYVECRYNNVFLFSKNEVISMRLSSKVHVFGFELSPRETGKFEMIVEYWDSQMNTLVGFTNHFADGEKAILLSVNSSVPFDSVKISYNSPVGNDDPTQGPGGYNFVNFRYAGVER
jgi:hypothetical protein